jgi:hypothetical protein
LAGVLAASSGRAIFDVRPLQAAELYATYVASPTVMLSHKVLAAFRGENSAGNSDVARLPCAGQHACCGPNQRLGDINLS